MLIGGILLAATLACYLPSFPGAFHFDDFALLLDNPRVTGEGLNFDDFFSHYGGRPLTLLTFRLNWLAAGNDPLPFHAVNLGLHLLTVMLLWRLVADRADDEWIGFGTALIFALHPAQVQVVDYIWSRSMILMAVFLLLAFLWGRQRPILAIVALQAAILSRAEALAFLPLFIAENRRYSRFLVFLCVSNLSGIALGLLEQDPVGFAWNHQAVWEYWGQAMVAFWKYWGLFLVPVRFSIHHAPEPVSTFAVIVAMIGLLAFATLAIFALWKLDRVPLGRGMVWIGAALVPAMVIPNPEPFNESRIYVATAGFALLTILAMHQFSAWLERRSRLDAASGAPRDTVAPGGRNPAGRSLDHRDKWRRFARCSWCFGLLLTGTGLVCGTMALARHRVWASDVSVWAEAVAHQPEDFFARYNLAAALARAGDRTAACREFGESVRLNPLDDMSYAGLGFCAEITGRWPDAAAEYRRALALEPTNQYARDGLERVSARMTIGGTKP